MTFVGSALRVRIDVDAVVDGSVEQGRLRFLPGPGAESIRYRRWQPPGRSRPPPAWTVMHNPTHGGPMSNKTIPVTFTLRVSRDLP